MSQIETVLTVIKDRFPHLREKKWLVALVLCFVFFSIGLTLTTNVGQHILVLLNNYGVSAAVYFYAMLEIVGIMWIYGIKNFCKDVLYMQGSSPGIFWKITWAFTAPVALIVLFVYGHIAEEADDTSLPTWATVIGWALAALAVIQIPIWAVHVIYRNPADSLTKKIMNSFKPTDDWGPSDPVDKAGWVAFKKESYDWSSSPKGSNVVTISVLYHAPQEEVVF